MDLLYALLGAVLGALAGGFLSVRAAARHWRRDRLLATWTSILEDLASLMTELPTLDADAVATSERQRELAERALHARATALDRNVSVLQLLADDDAANICKEAQDGLWNAVFAIGPGPPGPAIDRAELPTLLRDVLGRCFESVEGASQSLALHGRRLVALWTGWLRPRWRMRGVRES